MLSSILLAMAAATAEPAEPRTAATEMLGLDAPDEFEIGYQVRNAELQMIELVEPPETVDTWSKLITLQLFFGAASRGLDPFYDGWRRRMAGACAGLADTVVRGSVDGMPALRATLSCPLNSQTGKPENLEAVLVQGQANLMMVQVAFRRSPTAADKALVEHVVSSLKVCDQRSFAACSARQPTGFAPLIDARH